MSTTSSRKILAPLTTTFTPPPACASIYANANGYQSTQLYWLAQTCFGNAPRDEASCWPSVTVPIPTAPLNKFGFFSPGLICPVGYYPACTAALKDDGSPESVSGKSFKPDFPISAGETALGCCPSGFTCVDKYDQTCTRDVTSGRLDNVAQCTSNTFNVGPLDIGTGFPIPVAGGVSSFTIKTASLRGPLIQLVYKATDIVSSSTETSGGSLITDTMSVSTTSGANPNSSANSSSSSSGVNIGAVVGGTLGALLLLVICAAVFIFRRRRAKKSQPIHVAELSQAEKTTRRWEMPGKPRDLSHEMADAGSINELDTQEPRLIAELPAK